MTKEPKPFALGQLVATPGALDHITKEELITLVRRHTSADWGDMTKGDKRLNDQATHNGTRILSSYEIRGEKIWIITEWDRSVTTVLRSDEY